MRLPRDQRRRGSTEGKRYADRKRTALARPARDPDGRPVPMIDIHGTSDPEVPYRGGGSWVAPSHKGFPNQLTWAANWAQRNRCAPTPRDTVIAADVTRRAYTNCANNADVQLYTVLGGGHTWPGGGPHPEWLVARTSHSIDASSLMWAFFREHPLTRK